MGAAKSFFEEALDVVGQPPVRVTTDLHRSYPRAIREELGGSTRHRTNRYLNNWIEQDHRGIKARYGAMRGFGSFDSAARFCRVFDETRNFFRGTRRDETLSLRHQRHVHISRTREFNDLLRTG